MLLFLALETICDVNIYVKGFEDLGIELGLLWLDSPRRQYCQR